MPQQVTVGVPSRFKRKIEYIKSFKIPVVAGFGIKNPEHVKDIASVADGINW